MNCLRCLVFLTLSLASCTLVPVAQRSVDPSGLDYRVCDDGLRVFSEYRAFQGRGGWFFFEHDLEPRHPLMEQAAFITELGRRLKAQGVQLAVIPVPGRAVVAPDALYGGDPRQAAFRPDEAAAHYEAFVGELERGGVLVFDVVAEARALAERGKQTFFRRDLHWTTEGAEALLGGFARELKREDLGLPATEVTKKRYAAPYEHRGEFVSRWTYTHCGFALPTEPQPIYTVTERARGGLFGSTQPEVVLTGSSFSLPPYDYGFLAAGLQSGVLNVSVGAGGAVVGLQTYLVDGAYEAAKPKLLVWEFPTYAPSLTEAQRRELVASALGRCDAPAATLTLEGDGRVSARLGGGGAGYLQLEFSDLSVLTFDLVLTYRSGQQETLRVERSNLVPNRGLYLFTLNRGLGRLARANLELPLAEGQVSVRVCPERNPNVLAADR